ncbi:hypothetical protein MD484_g2720, partial [Candolleomyces efflorescens]
MSLSPLLPVVDFEFGFTTSLCLNDERLLRCELADKALGVHKVSSKTTHHVVKPPEPRSARDFQNQPRLAWEAFYPEGSINPSAPIPGGFGFYLSGPPEFQERLAVAKEAVFSYRMMLQQDWEWVRGGKLPGLFGGINDLAYGCSGGRKDDRCQCIGLRPMWRVNGTGELYTYLPLNETNATQQLKVPPLSVENSDYGFSVGRGAYNFKQAVGNWVAVAIRVRLNDIGVDNGEIEVWIDGCSVISIDGLALRSSTSSVLRGMHFQTFFGGSSPEWASPKDQRAWFADITGAIVA